MVNNWETVEKNEDDVKKDKVKSDLDLCVNCLRRPRWAPHKFCSKECGRTCRLPDCWEKKHDGSLYCSQPHRKAAVTLGIAPGCARCGIFPKEPGSQYCGKTCTGKAANGVAAAPPSPLMRPGTAHIPRPPSAFMRPRSAYQVSFGSHKGEPNFLLRSKRGVVWANLPSSLDKLCSKDNFADDILDFSLGTDGKYYLAYKDGGEVKLATSKKLWDQLDEDFHGGSVRQIQFGAEGTVWGLKSYRVYHSDDKEKEKPSKLSLPTPTPSTSPYTVREQPFGHIPDSLLAKSAEIYPDLRHYGQVDFVSVGMGGSWVVGVMGKLCFWDKIAAGLVKKMTRVYEGGGALRNVVLSPVSDEIYLLEAKDGTVTYRVPDEWHAQMRLHLRNPEKNGLDMDPPGQPHPHQRHRNNNGRPVRINPNVLRQPRNYPPGVGGPGPSTVAPPPYVPPPSYSAPPLYTPTDPNVLYASNAPSSGFIQAPAGRNHIDGNFFRGGNEVLVAVMESAPAVLHAGVNLVGVLGLGGAEGEQGGGEGEGECCIM